MEEKIKRVLEEFRTDSKGTASPQELRNKYFGRKNGMVTLLMKELQLVPPAEKPVAGKQVNELKLALEAELDGLEAGSASQALAERLQAERVDVTLPGNRRPIGHSHPLTLVRSEIEDIFSSMGYWVEDGPEIETTFYNFEALNIPEHHPARDSQDTFYISDTLLLRTHTSPVQIRTMQKQRPPLRIICPGKVYRRDNPDATHSPAFQQIEGLAVDESLTFRDFKGTLEYFLKAFFSQKTKVRFRPSYFAFTEPSAEVDISCIFCAGVGCRVCKTSGWIEVLGAGMVDPAVFRYVDYDPEKYTGFAFGLGIERFAMLKYSVNNIQYFYESDLRFLEQF
ncbi:MAG: phenylalanine--tRNA ligase subunit alpha [Acidobacteria bacterium]|nr:phenylalanine--tRNA ligase subunit alpha [Acidobacteriota bacterium]MCI0718167.1 phenylalanine--tRNA ligase subunit alpha [Acidobacteriota bacterium]